MMWAAAALGAYLSILSGVDSPERAAAIDSLAAWGDVAAVASAMRRTNWRVRAGLFDALEKMGDLAPAKKGAIVDSLISIAIRHPKLDAQRLAIRSLGRVGGAAARDYLSTMTRSVHRDLVAEALGAPGDSTAAPALRKLVTDRHPDVRRRAALALAQVVGDGAVDDLAVLLDDAHHGVRFAVAEVLHERGDPAGEAVLRHWDGYAFPGKFQALRLLGRLRYAPALPIIEGMLHHRDWSLRAAAADAMGALDDLRVLSVLDAAYASEQHPYVRLRLQAAMDVLRSR